VGTPIYGQSQLKAGDLLFAAGSDGTPENPGHVGMYIGNGDVIEAPRPARKSGSPRCPPGGQLTPPPCAGSLNEI
jgi:cell wall-associated NlpC family hydrolase